MSRPHWEREKHLRQKSERRKITSRRKSAQQRAAIKRFQAERGLVLISEAEVRITEFTIDQILPAALFTPEEVERILRDLRNEGIELPTAKACAAAGGAA